MNQKIRKLDNVYLLKGLLPVMLLYTLDSVLFTTSGFSEYVQPVFQIVMVVYATILSLYNIVSKKAFAGKKIVTFSMLVFIIVNFISFFITYDNGDIFAFYLVYMVGIHYFALGLPRLDIAPDKRRQGIEIVVYIFIVISTFVNIVLLCVTMHSGTLLDIIHGETRLSGFISHPNVLGFYSSMAAFLASYIFMKFKNKLILFLSATSFLINCVTLYLSKSRSAEILLIVSFALLFIIIAYRKFSRKIFLSVLVACFILGVIFAAFIILSRGVDESLSLYALIDSISSGRISLYKAGIEAGISSPLYGNSYSYLSEIYSPVHMAHNIFIDLFARYGLLSLLAFCIFNFSLLFYAFKIVGTKNKVYMDSSDFRLFIVGLSLIVGLLVQHLFDIAIYYTGFSASNVLYLIFAGYLAYWSAKLD